MSARQSAMRGPVGAGKNSQEAETQPRHNIPAGEPGKRTLEHGTPRGAPVVPPECETRCGMRGVSGGRQGRTSGLRHRPRGGYLYTRGVTTFFHAACTAHRADAGGGRLHTLVRRAPPSRHHSTWLGPAHLRPGWLGLPMGSPLLDPLLKRLLTFPRGFAGQEILHTDIFI